MTDIDTAKVREGLTLGMPTDLGHLIDLAYDLCSEVDRLRAKLERVEELRQLWRVHAGTLPYSLATRSLTRAMRNES
jgi:hypothetical protein